MLRCKDCGNEAEFSVGVKEYARWIIDSKKDYLYHEDGYPTDHDMGDDFCCTTCDSWNVEDIKDA